MLIAGASRVLASGAWGYRVQRRKLCLMKKAWKTDGSGVVEVAKHFPDALVEGFFFPLGCVCVCVCVC